LKIASHFVRQKPDTIHVGTGEKAINFSGEQNINRNYTIKTSPTASSTVKIGSASQPFTSSKGRYVINVSGLHGIDAFDVYTGKPVTRDNLTLIRGSLIIDILNGQIQLHFTDVDTNDLSSIDDLFERITFNDSFALTYQDVLDLGFGFDGTDGDDVLDGTEIVDRLNGFAGNDILDGGKGDDELDGGNDNDILIGGNGNDILIGNTGNDQLEGSIGDDVYIIDAGDGDDTILETDGIDKVVFGEGLSVTDLNVSRSGDNLILSFSSGQSITVADWFDESNAIVEQFIFTENNLLTIDNIEIESLVDSNNINLAPGVNTGLINQVSNEDAPFSYTIANDAFIDPNGNDTLTFSATLVNGDPLPAWLSFDAATRTFSGTPDNPDVGNIDVIVSAIDNGGLSVSDTFSITINENTNTNNAPIVNTEISDQFTDEDMAFSFTVPVDTFLELDAGDALTYSASLSDDTSLPGWLSFDAATQTFSGTPYNDNVGNISIKVTATDTGGLSVSDIFNLTVNNVNDAAIVSSDSVTLDETNEALTTSGVLTASDVDNPDNTFTANTIVGAIGTFVIDVNGNWSFTANDAYDSLNVGDSVNETFNVTTIDGTPSTVDITIVGTNDGPVAVDDFVVIDEDTSITFRPGSGVPIEDGLLNDFDVDSEFAVTNAFNAVNGSLSFSADGVTFTPDENFSGLASFDYTITDTEGVESTATTYITVNPVNDAPTLNNAISDQSIDEDAPFSFSVPTDAFNDVDTDDSLSFSASLSNDDALPDWLSFDRATQTFNGTPDNDDIDTITIKVTATDNGGLSVSDEFNVVINNVNDAPVVANAIADQVVNENDLFSFNVPANTFFDEDSIHGDTLTYSATLSDDSALPDWLSFDALIQTFSGTPGFADYGDLDIKLTATDTGDLSASDEFTVTINVPDATVGTEGDDVLNGSHGPDTLIGLGGNDVINGGNNHDRLSGGAGDDELNGSHGNDILFGGLGNDSLNGGNGNDFLSAGEGDNTLIGSNGNDELIAGSGNDSLDGGNGNDILNAGDGNNILIAGHGNDVLTSGSGNDTLNGGTGNDILNAGDGNNTLIGDHGNDELTSGSGDDTLNGGTGNDILNAVDGNNTLIGDHGNDQLTSGSGDDTLDGGTGNDIFSAGAGNDQMFGGHGNDIYQFNNGFDNDIISETSGSDTVNFSGVDHQDLWFWRSGDDLKIGVLNMDDQLTIEDWYSNGNKRVETFNTQDDSFVLSESNVQQLVDAMAIFSVTGSGSLNVPQQIQDDVQSVITTAWQTA
jgi:VCBS repeat-containing protein